MPHAVTRRPKALWGGGSHGAQGSIYRTLTIPLYRNSASRHFKAGALGTHNAAEEREHFGLADSFLLYGGHGLLGAFAQDFSDIRKLDDCFAHTCFL